ncbi:hypothetical protein BX666DRAFT_1959771 [Dichotomocladium elegans]|nr:hypothetical protein BX666DRAFT_1959771 [Dichotomocladium elegans]
MWLTMCKFSMDDPELVRCPRTRSREKIMLYSAQPSCVVELLEVLCCLGDRRHCVFARAREKHTHTHTQREREGGREQINN